MFSFLRICSFFIPHLVFIGESKVIAVINQQGGGGGGSVG